MTIEILDGPVSLVSDALSTECSTRHDWAEYDASLSSTDDSRRAWVAVARGGTGNASQRPLPDKADRSRTAHLIRAHQALAGMALRGEASESVCISALRAIAATVFDGSPTPRPTFVGDHTVEVHWLVGGDTVELAFLPDGEVDALAVRADGTVMTDVESASLVDFMGSGARNIVVRELKRMSGALTAASRPAIS